MTELTTHFVSFLKSLALRMNTQTLQFFLKFPSDVQENGDVSENTADENQTGSDDEMKQLRTQKLEFPLYERALDFCAAHQDSFVRVTAMNICLNTLRLTTVWESGETDSEKDIPPTITSSTASPTGALHTAKPLPFRERFLIAQFACIPSRVERLISPLFTKLAERWNALDEQIREIDANKSQVASNTFDVRGSKSEKIARVKEQVRRERLLRAFQDKAADLQDVLLLLDDVFRVGLTVLNEQMIEMMFATFVYPLLLQPLPGTPVPSTAVAGSGTNSIQFFRSSIRRIQRRHQTCRGNGCFCFWTCKDGSLYYRIRISFLDKSRSTAPALYGSVSSSFARFHQCPNSPQSS